MSLEMNEGCSSLSGGCLEAVNVIVDHGRGVYTLLLFT